MENLQRQLDELQALRAMYPEDEGCFQLQPAEQQALAVATAAVNTAAGSELVQDIYVSNLTGTVTLPDRQLAGSPVSLRFQLPTAYPAEAAAQVTVVCSGPRLVHERLNAAMTAAAQDALGSESLLLLLDTLQEEVQSADRKLAQQQQQQHQQSQDPGPSIDQLHGSPSIAAHSCRNCLLRTVIWFHHIKSTEKRKNLVGWARELGIEGFSKPGFPGLVIAEGFVRDVREYVARIRALQWQAMQVRGEEFVRCPACAVRTQHSMVGDEGTVSAMQGDASSQSPCTRGTDAAGLATSRGFGGGFEELPESGMSELGKHCKDAEMEELFMLALKLAK